MHTQVKRTFGGRILIPGLEGLPLSSYRGLGGLTSKMNLSLCFAVLSSDA